MCINILHLLAVVKALNVCDADAGWFKQQVARGKGKKLKRVLQSQNKSSAGTQMRCRVKSWKFVTKETHSELAEVTFFFHFNDPCIISAFFSPFTVSNQLSRYQLSHIFNITFHHSSLFFVVLMKQLLGIKTRGVAFFSPLEEELQKTQRRNRSLFWFFSWQKV